MKIIFTAFSKRNFYLRHQISAFTLLNDGVPVSPFMNYEYNLSGLVDKSHIRVANNTMISKCDELWVFGEVSDGVLIEIFLGQKQKKPIKFFSVNERIEKIKETARDEVVLEDVSPWMWEWVLTNKNLARWHPRLRFKKRYPLIYPAYSKHNFFWQMHISKFCIEKLVVPLNPFMLFRYFLTDMIPRDLVYMANRDIVRISDEVWVFGEISDGVLAEVRQAKKENKKVRYYKIIDKKPEPARFRLVSSKSAVFEGCDADLEKYRHEL